MVQVSKSAVARIALVVLAVAAAGLTLGGVAGAIPTQPLAGAVLSPASMEVGTTGDVTMAFSTAPSSPFKGEVRATVPAGWTAPQPASVAAGGCKKAGVSGVEGTGPWAVVMRVDCKAGASFTLTMAGMTAPTVAGSSLFSWSAVTQRAEAAAPVQMRMGLTPGPLAALTLDPPSATVMAGTAVGFSATGADRFGNAVDPGTVSLAMAPDGSCAAMACTPGSAGTQTVTATSGSATGSATVEATPEVVTIAPDVLPAGAPSAPYAAALSAPGALRGASFAVVAGALPPGIALSPSGSISGTPTRTGRATFRVRATDGNGVSGERDLSINVTLPLVVSVDSVAFPSTRVGATSAPVSITITNNGGAGYVLGARGLSSEEFAAPIEEDSCFTIDALEPGRSCTALVYFTPTVAGPAEATIEWAYDIGTLTVTLTGTAT